jgi:peptide subunit release factor 1 (eRF1)
MDEEIGKITSERCDLISLYLPSGIGISETIKQLYSERKLATTIKDDLTSSNVQKALDKLIEAVSSFETITGNGLIIFVSKDVYHHTIPKTPLKQRIYWCDRKFKIINEDVTQLGRVADF